MHFSFNLCLSFSLNVFFAFTQDIWAKLRVTKDICPRLRVTHHIHLRGAHHLGITYHIRAKFRITKDIRPLEVICLIYFLNNALLCKFVGLIFDSFCRIYRDPESWRIWRRGY